MRSYSWLAARKDTIWLSRQLFWTKCSGAQSFAKGSLAQFQLHLNAHEWFRHIAQAMCGVNRGVRVLRCCWWGVCRSVQKHCHSLDLCAAHYFHRTAHKASQTYFIALR